MPQENSSEQQLVAVEPKDVCASENSVAIFKFVKGEISSDQVKSAVETQNRVCALRTRGYTLFQQILSQEDLDIGSVYLQALKHLSEAATIGSVVIHYEDKLEGAHVNMKQSVQQAWMDLYR